MKKAVLLGLVTLLVIGLAVSVYAKAEKRDLKDGSGNVVGFVIFNNPDPTDEGTNLTVLVSLKQGEPYAQYQVTVHINGSRIKSPYPPYPLLEANSRGRGNWELRPVWLTPHGEYEVYATLAKVGNSTVLTSDTATIVIKGYPK